MTATQMKFDTTDVDEARAFSRQLFFDHRLEPLRDGSDFSLDLVAGRLGPLSMGLIRHGCECTATLAANDLTYSIAVSLRGSLEVRAGKAEVASGPTSGVIAGPTADVRVRGWAKPDDRAFLLAFDRHVLEAEVRQATGRAVNGPLHIDPKLDLRTGRGAEWWELAKTLVMSLDEPSDLVFNPLMAAPLTSALIAGFLTSTDHRYRELLELHARPTHHTAIQRAVTYIHDHAHEPLTISILAALINVSPQTFRRDFRSQVGTNPYAYIWQVRMDRAHTELLMGTPSDTTVARVARRWGFAVAEFKTEYQLRFGKAAADTLRIC